ncbi:MAG: MFS transporter [bacterium]
MILSVKNLDYWKKNLIFIWISQFFGMVAMSAVTPFLPLFIRDLGVVESHQISTWSGLVFAGPFLISFFITPLWGNLGDKYGRKIITLRAIVGLAVAQILVGLSQDVYQLFLSRVLQGALSGFVPAALALVASNTPKEKTAYALGVLQTATASGTIFGPLIGGFLADSFGFRAVFFIVSGTLFLTAVFFSIYVTEYNVVDKNAKRDSSIDNWKYVFSNKSMLYISIMIFFAALGMSIPRPIFALYFETFNINVLYFATITGCVYATIGVTNSISPPWWGKKTLLIGYKKVIIYSALISGIMYISHFFVYNMWLLFIIRAFLGFGLGGLAPILFAAMSENVPQSKKGGVLSIASSFQILGNSIGLMGGGFIAGLTDFRFPFLLAGICYLSIIGFASKVLKSKKE